MLPYQHGVRENAGFRLSPKTPTAATRLKAKGYATGAFVGAYVLDSRYGLATTSTSTTSSTGISTSSSISRSSRPARRTSSGRRSTGTARRRASSVSCGCTSTIPTRRTTRRRTTRNGISDDLYFGEVAYTDASIAPLLEVLRNVHPAPLVVVTGDHGEGFGDHGELTHGLFCYEATLHVPLIVWCPDLVPPGRNAVWARHIDIVPTMLDALGEPKPPELTGQSLLPAGRVEAPEGSYFEALSAAFNRGWAPLRGIASEGVKYIDLPIQELYELPTDPTEEKNLAPGTPDSLRRLRKRLLDLPAAPQERGMIGSEEAAKLRSLGYLTGLGRAQDDLRSRRRPEDADQGRSDDSRLHRSHAGREVRRGHRGVPPRGPGKPAHEDRLPEPRERARREEGRARARSGSWRRRPPTAPGARPWTAGEACLLSEIGRSAEAVKVLGQYQESEDPESLNALGIVLSDAGRPAEALPIFARAIELDASGADGYQNTGIALLKLNRPAEARDNLETALRFGKRHARPGTRSAWPIAARRRRRRPSQPGRSAWP